MDETQQNSQVTSPVTPTENGKTKITVKFTGADGSEGYKNGEIYTLDKWEENNMFFIAREDGTGQVAYDSQESMLQNWEVQTPTQDAPAV